jgi:hypothetical protein
MAGAISPGFWHSLLPATKSSYYGYISILTPLIIGVYGKSFAFMVQPEPRERNADRYLR